MSVKVIKDIQRLDELTEWCRNKPEDAAVRIMHSEGLAEEVGNKTKDEPKTPIVYVNILEQTSRYQISPFILPEPTTYKFEVESTLGFRILAKSFTERTIVRITDGTFNVPVMIRECSLGGLFEAEAVRLAK